MQVVKDVKTHWNVVIFQVKQVVPANKSNQLVYEEVVFELSDDRNDETSPYLCQWVQYKI